MPAESLDEWMNEGSAPTWGRTELFLTKCFVFISQMLYILTSLISIWITLFQGSKWGYVTAFLWLQFPPVTGRVFLQLNWTEVAQSCPSLCDPTDLPGFSVHGVFQERVLESVGISFSRDLPNPGIEPRSPALQADAFTIWATREGENT